MVSKRKRNESKRMDRLYARGPGGAPGGRGFGAGASASSAGGAARGGGRGGGAGGANKRSRQLEGGYAARNKSRFQVLGKQENKHSKTGRFQVLREAKVSRERSLLVEHQRRGNANIFNDRRFGEDDHRMTEEDKAILRFQKERVKQQKQRRFALEDEDDDELGFGHEESLFDEDRLGEDKPFGGADDGKNQQQQNAKCTTPTTPTSERRAAQWHLRRARAHPFARLLTRILFSSTPWHCTSLVMLSTRRR